MYKNIKNLDIYTNGFVILFNVLSLIKRIIYIILLKKYIIISY
jgi:hypothetical protein